MRSHAKGLRSVACSARRSTTFSNPLSGSLQEAAPEDGVEEESVLIRGGMRRKGRFQPMRRHRLAQRAKARHWLCSNAFSVTFKRSLGRAIYRTGAVRYSSGFSWIKRVGVASCLLRHDKRCSQRGEIPCEEDRTTTGGPRVSPGDFSQFKAIVVKIEVEAGAWCPVQAGPEAGALFGDEQAAAQGWRRCARDFIGLGRIVEVARANKSSCSLIAFSIAFRISSGEAWCGG